MNTKCVLLLALVALGARCDASPARLLLRGAKGYAQQEEQLETRLALEAPLRTMALAEPAIKGQFAQQEAAIKGAPLAVKGQSVQLAAEPVFQQAAAVKSQSYIAEPALAVQSTAIKGQAPMVATKSFAQQEAVKGFAQEAVKGATLQQHETIAQAAIKGAPLAVKSQSYLAEPAFAVQHAAVKGQMIATKGYSQLEAAAPAFQTYAAPAYAAAPAFAAPAFQTYAAPAYATKSMQLAEPAIKGQFSQQEAVKGIAQHEAIAQSVKSAPLAVKSQSYQQLEARL